MQIPDINANLCQPIAVNEASEPGVEPEESRNPCNLSAFEMWTSNEKLIAESKVSIDCNRWDKEKWDEALQRLSILSQEARKWIFENGNREKLQQCPLPNLECGETTKERLVELLNSIYPDQESTKSDINGFSISAAAPFLSKYFSEINLSECRQEREETEETKTDCESPLMLSRSNSVYIESDEVLTTSLPTTIVLKDINLPKCPEAEESVAEFYPKYFIDSTRLFQAEDVSTVNPTCSKCIEDTGSSKCPNIQAENSLSVTNTIANYLSNASEHKLADDSLSTFDSPLTFIGMASPKDKVDNSSSCLRDAVSSTRVEEEGNIAERLPKSYVGVNTHIQAENLSTVSSTSSYYLQDMSSSKGALKTTASTEKCRRLRAIRKEAKNQRRLQEETVTPPSTAVSVQQQVEESLESTQIALSKEKLVKFQTKSDEEVEEATKPVDADFCGTPIALVDVCQNSVDEYDVFIDNHSEFKTNTINHFTDVKLAKARDIVMNVGLWCRHRMDKSVFRIAAVENLVKETPIFQNLPFAIATAKDYPSFKFSKARDMLVGLGPWCREQMDKSAFHVDALEKLVTRTSILKDVPLKIASAKEYIGAKFFMGRDIAMDVGRWCRSQINTYAFPDAVLENFVMEMPIMQHLTVSIALADDDTDAEFSLEQDAALDASK